MRPDEVVIAAEASVSATVPARGYVGAVADELGRRTMCPARWKEPLEDRLELFFIVCGPYRG